MPPTTTQLTTSARLLSYLAAYGRAYPRAWEQAEGMRLDRDGLPDWPDWCYLPMAGWYSIISHQRHGGGPLTMGDDTGDMAPLAALGAWRYTQGIYRYHPDILAALLDTPHDGDIPVDVLYRLPEWSVYIDLDGADIIEGLTGVWAYLEHDVNNNDHELRYVLDLSDGLVTGPIVHIGAWSVEHALFLTITEAQANILAGLAGPQYTDISAIAPDDATGREYASFVGRLLSLTLYLCTDEPEIDGHTPGSRPHYPEYKRTKHGMRLYPPDKPRIWRIGEQTGEMLLREATAVTYRPGHAGDHKSPRPHIRRAHWHGYWTGPLKPRDDGQEQRPRRFSCRWLPPIVVGAGEG